MKKLIKNKFFWIVLCLIVILFAIHAYYAPLFKAQYYDYNSDITRYTYIIYKTGIIKGKTGRIIEIFDISIPLPYTKYAKLEKDELVKLKELAHNVNDEYTDYINENNNNNNNEGIFISTPNLVTLDGIPISKKNIFV